MSARKLTATSVIGGALGFIAMSVVAGLLVAAAVTPAAAVTGMAASNSASVFDGLPEYLKIDPLATRSTMFAKKGGKDVPIATFYSQNRIIDNWNQVGQVVKDAAVSTEDPRFYEHGAIDVQGTTRAIVSDVLHKSGETQGGSSITQQYVKNVRVQSCEKYDVVVGSQGTEAQTKAAQAAMNKKYQSCYTEYTDQNPARKIQEMKLAIGVEKQYSKQQILLGYLNIAAFGGQVYGVESAARYYFDTTAAKLTLPQAATLIAIVNNPNNLRVDQPGNKLNGTANHYAKTLDRRNYVLRSMLKNKAITQPQYAAAVKTPIQPKITPQASGCAQAASQDAAFYCNAVMYEMQNNPAFGPTASARSALLSHGGLSIYTPLNLDLQASAQADLSHYIPASSTQLDLGAADVSVELNTGRVVMAVQNRPYNATNTPSGSTTPVAYTFDYNHGGSSGFQTGSTYKAFSLVEWLKTGHALNDVVNAPVTRASIPQTDFHSSCDSFAGAGNWSVGNDEAGEGGPMTVMTATQLSINTAFAVMGEQIDLCQLRNDAAALGVKPAYPYQQTYNSKGQLVNVTDSSGKPVAAQLGDTPASILGTNNIAPVDMAVAYAGIANGGKTCSPVYIDKVTDSAGKSLPVPQTKCTQAIDPKVAAGVTYALQHGPLIGNGTGVAANPQDGVPIMGKTGTTDSAVQNWLVTSTTKVANAVWVGNVQAHQVGDTYANTGFGSLYFNGVWGRNVKFSIAKPILQELDRTYGGAQFPTPDSVTINGPQQKLPDLSGDSVAQAKTVLAGLGFTYQDGGEKDSDVAKGDVAGTNPPAGSMLSKGSAVQVYTSKGDEVAVPPLTGKSLADASKAIAEAGLTGQFNTGADPNGTVTAQSPAAGTSVRRGTTVTITVSGGSSHDGKKSGEDGKNG